MEPLEASNDEAQDAREVVLIVEDDFLIRWPAAEYLRDSGYRVIEAGTAGEAMVVFSSGTHVDVVFSDINLAPQLTGYAFARWLGDNHPHIPVLLTSGDATASPRAPIGIPFIPKPYALAEVDERIKELLARRRARVSS
jgi:DNA-binding NtrC family response regulator